MASTLPTRKKLARQIAGLARNEAVARRLLSDAVETRAEILGRLRELRAAYASLGEVAYTHLKQSVESSLDDPALEAQSLKVRIDGLHTEIAQLQEKLSEFLKSPPMAETRREETAESDSADDGGPGKKDLSDLF